MTAKSIIPIFASCILLTAMSHHTKCDYAVLVKEAKNPNEKINSLMHAPMMCESWVESGNAEIDFLSNMIPHHQGAILSSQTLLKYAKNKELIAIAQNIISSQEQEIKEFQALIKTLKKDKSQGYDKFTKQAKKDMAKMMQEMHQIKPSGNLERDYMTAMIVHHQGAIDASKQILQYTKNEKIIKIAQAIITEQEKEIEAFKNLLTKSKILTKQTTQS